MRKIEVFMVFVPWLVAVFTVTSSLIMSNKLFDARVEIIKLKYQLKECENESRASE